MYGIFLSAINTALRYLLGGSIIKYVSYAAIYFLITDILASLVSHLPNLSALNSAFSGIPPSLWYFLGLIDVSYGVSSMLSAYALRFAIRRLPFIG